MRKGGLVNHLPQQTLSKTTVPQQDEPDCKHNLLSPLIENHTQENISQEDTPLSPIGNDTNDMWANLDFEDGDNFANQPLIDSPTYLNLGTPEKLILVHLKNSARKPGRNGLNVKVGSRKSYTCYETTLKIEN